MGCRTCQWGSHLFVNNASSFFLFACLRTGASMGKHFAKLNNIFETSKKNKNFSSVCPSVLIWPYLRPKGTDTVLRSWGQRLMGTGVWFLDKWEKLKTSFYWIPNILCNYLIIRVQIYEKEIIQTNNLPKNEKIQRNNHQNVITDRPSCLSQGRLNNRCGKW